MSVLQIEFTKFPGVEPWTTIEGWPHLPLPAEKPPADPDDPEIIPDAALRLVEYAMQYAPEEFGVDLLNGDYEAVNDLSLDMLGVVLSAIDHGERHPCPGGVRAEWYVDAELTGGITLRVAEFK